jgi:hypothetical protein
LLRELRMPPLSVLPAEMDLAILARISKPEFVRSVKTINLFANKNWSQIISDRYKITSYPKWMLIDRTGKVMRERLEGPGDPEIDEWIKKVL